MAGYHLADIPHGTFGEISKIVEEVSEVLDADRQMNPVMVLQELSDLVGAIEGYLEKYHPSITLGDLLVMMRATQRAFKSGRRK